MSTKHPHSHDKNANQSADLADGAADLAGEAGNRLKAAFENTREFVTNVRDKTVAGAKATDKAVQKHPYKFIALAAGAGLLFGLIMARRHASKKSAEQD